MRALVIEDDADLRQQVCSYLADEGFAVDSAPDGEQGLYMATEYPADIAIIDLGLPKTSGIDIIRRVREDGRKLPILILTARDGWESKVEGLEAGADDYLVKPFHRKELMARTRALLRRAAGWSHSVLNSGPVSINSSAQTVTVSGATVDLTAYEYKVLEYLMIHAGEVISKTTLTEHLYAEDDDRDSNVIEVFIRRLRLKLDPDNQLKPIDTLRGRGYRWRLPRD